MSIGFKLSKSKSLLILLYFSGFISVGSIFLAMPFSSKVGSMPVIDALFTATSAVCVTGLTTVDTLSYSRFGQFVIILLIQFGGLGIITFSTLYVFIPMRRTSVTARGLASDYAVPSIEYRAKKIIAHILAWTAGFELAGALIILPVLLNNSYTPFDAIFQSISAFCNAGFSTFKSGMESFRDEPVTNIVTMALIVFGGLGFIVLEDIAKNLKKEKLHLSYHSSVVLRTTASLIIVGALLIYLLERENAFKSMSVASKIMASFFQSITARTAGFNTVPQANFSNVGQFITIILMFIGASPGSTGGGIKTTTFYLLLVIAFGYRESSDELIDKNRTIMPSLVIKVVTILVRAVIIVLFASSALLLAEHAHGNYVGIETAVFECVSAFGTVGLSIGITPHLSSISKLILIATMFMGRVGLFAMAIPQPRNAAERYAQPPQADILVG